MVTCRLSSEYLPAFAAAAASTRAGTSPVNQQAQSMKCTHSPINRPPPSSRSWIQLSRAMKPPLTRYEITSGSPALSNVSFIRSESGAKRRLKPAMSTGRRASDAYTRSISSSSAEVMQSGFSTKTCLPASIAASPSGACVDTGVAITTASTFGSASTSSKALVVRTAG